MEKIKNGGIMKLLVISDIHGNKGILHKMDDIFTNVDGVLFAGDFAVCFEPETGLEVLEDMCKKHENLFAVRGNCDSIDFIDELEERGVCAENTISFLNGISIAGSGGALIFKDNTEFERQEDDLLSDFDILKNTVSQSGENSLWKSTILISHNPPKANNIDKIAAGFNVGSQKFTELIEENQPLAVICGHIHEAAGIEKINNTTVINPGSLDENSYAILEIEKDEEENWFVKNVELLKVK